MFDVLDLDDYKLKLSRFSGPPSSPSKPTVTSVTKTSLKLKWNAPAHDGHSPVTAYQVELLQQGLKGWQPIMTVDRTSCTVRTLEQNIVYQFRVRAMNKKHGLSDPSLTSDDTMIKSKGRAVISPFPKSQG